MKKLLTIIPLVILLCFSFSCQQGEEVAEGVAPDKIVPSDLKDTHSAFFEGVLAEDTKILNEVLSDNVTLGYADGSRKSKDEFLSAFQSGELFYDTAEHEAVDFHIYGNTAVVTGRINFAYRLEGNEGVERLSYTAVYVSTDGEWKMVAWHSSLRPE